MALSFQIYSDTTSRSTLSDINLPLSPLHQHQHQHRLRLRARNLETKLNDKLAGAGRSVSSGDRFLVSARKEKYADASLYQPGQADQLNRKTPDVDTKRILQAEAVGYDGENISFRDVTDDALAQEKMESGAAEGENVAEIAGTKQELVEYYQESPEGDSDGIDGLRGPVDIMPPQNATSEQIAQIKAYIEGSNQALLAGMLSPSGRVSTSGALRIRANAAVAKERARAFAAGTPYKGHVGHVPDTTWTGSADPSSWLDLDPLVNTSIGGQAKRYPLGYKPTEFRYKERK